MAQGLDLLALCRKQGDEFEAVKESHAVPHHGSQIELYLRAVLLWQEKLQVGHLSGAEMAGDDSAHSCLRQIEAAAVNANLTIVSEDPHNDGKLGAVPGKASTRCSS
jgi:hypothetical protein